MSDVHLISQENYDRLVEAVIADAQPQLHLACDYLGHVPEPLIYPLVVYRQIEELRNGNSTRRVEAS